MKKGPQKKKKGEEYKQGAKGRGITAKAQTPLNVFCQGNKDQLTAAAIYQHSERECKSALMQMLYVSGAKQTVFIPTPPPPTQHTSLCIRTPQTLLQSCTETHTHTHFQERSVITRDNIISLLHSKQKGRVQ